MTNGAKQNHNGLLLDLLTCIDRFLYMFGQCTQQWSRRQWQQSTQARSNLALLNITHKAMNLVETIRGCSLQNTCLKAVCLCGTTWWKNSRFWKLAAHCSHFSFLHK